MFGSQPVVYMGVRSPLGAHTSLFTYSILSRVCNCHLDFHFHAHFVVASALAVSCSSFFFSRFFFSNSGGARSAKERAACTRGAQHGTRPYGDSHQ